MWYINIHSFLKLWILFNGNACFFFFFFNMCNWAPLNEKAKGAVRIDVHKLRAPCLNAALGREVSEQLADRLHYAIEHCSWTNFNVALAIKRKYVGRANAKTVGCASSTFQPIKRERTINHYNVSESDAMCFYLPNEPENRTIAVSSPTINGKHSLLPQKKKKKILLAFKRKFFSLLLNLTHLKKRI